MAMVQKSTTETKFYLTNPHGDVVATVDNSPSPTGVDYYSEYTEYGGARVANVGDERYGWLGGAQRATETIGGLTLMGDRLYNPVTGRFLQSDDPISGVVCNSYGYVCGDPVNSSDAGKAALPGPIICRWCRDLYTNLGPQDKQALACITSFGYERCHWGKQISDAASEFARKKIGQVETPLRSAIRHFIWQVLTTIAFGTEFAKQVADNHEKYAATNKKESDFDQEINRIARDYARTHEKELRKMWREKGLDALMEYLFDEAMFLFCGKVMNGFKIDCHQVTGIATAPEGTHSRFY
ncbi:RHS repeat-associated core domain-containing protein [Sphaerisporangium flaviroseum]